MKINGLAISAALVSLGAPFWFDILCTVTRIRSAGNKPEEAAGQKRGS